MEVQISIGGVPTTITAKDPAEAVAFLSMWERRQGMSGQPVPATLPPVGHVAPAPPVTATATAVTDAVMRGVLERLRGTLTAKVVACLSQRESGMSDAEIRATINKPDLNLGPCLATVSKSCGKSGKIPAGKSPPRASGPRCPDGRGIPRRARCAPHIPGRPIRPSSRR